MTHITVDESNPFVKFDNIESAVEAINKETIVYICAKCGNENKFKIKESEISCPKCQNRVLYKKRTTEPVEFEAK